MAYIAIGKKNWKEADVEMQKVLEMLPEDDTAASNYAYLLNEMHRYKESNAYLDKSDELRQRRGVFGPSELNARMKADNYARLGDMESAYEWEKIYSSRLDSIQNLKQKEEVTKSRVLFDTEKKEQTIALQKARTRNLYTIIIFIVFIFISILTGMFVFINRRNKRYRQSTERIRMMVSQERAMRDLLNARDMELSEIKKKIIGSKKEEILSEKNDNDETPKKSDPPMDSKQKLYDKIFNDIVCEIIDKEGYKDITLTRDVLSERVGCNHTYLTETIKSKTGMSYSSYLNSVRVNEAVRLLTDCTDMSLEDLARFVGFLSLKSFYTSFKEFVGVPPGKFRKLIIENQSNAS